MLSEHVEMIDDPGRADFQLSLNFLPDDFPLDRTLLILREPPTPLFAPLYAQRADCHTVITYLPDGPNQFVFTTRPYLFPYRPGQNRLSRPTLSPGRRGVYFAGRGGREDYTNIHGAIALTSARTQLGLYLLKNHAETHLFGRDWPTGVSSTQGQGYRTRKLEEIERLQPDFVLCLENMMYRNYISEKIHDGFQSDRVVLYLGEPRITDYVPADCFVDLRPYFDAASGRLDCPAVLDLIRNMPPEQYETLLVKARAWHHDLHHQNSAEKTALTQFLLKRMGI